MRIAHISDLHLRHHLQGTSAVPTRLSRQMVELYPRALDRIVSAAPDLIVVSGDLVDHPFEEMDRADHLAAGEQDLRWHAQILTGLGMPVVVLPGNHDHLPLYHQVFDQETDLDVKGTRILSFADVEGDDNVPRRTNGERARFEACLVDDDPRPQIHLQHYLVYPRRDEGYPHTYEDGEQMRQAMTESGRVRLCLSGHYHLGHEPECVDGIWFAVAPAFCEAPHAWRVYDLEPAGGGLTWHQEQLS
jgi:3',5'-cyclic-AMP phosphodiesterase